MSVEILPFTRADIGDAFELWRATEGMGLFGDTPEVITGCLERAPGLSFVAREGEALVGAVLCTHDGRRGYLHHLAVTPAHRRRGTGRALADRSLAALEQLGIRRCHLFVRRGNDAAVAFWAHAGWVERGDIIMMSMTLPAEG